MILKVGKNKEEVLIKETKIMKKRELVSEEKKEEREEEQSLNRKY